MTRLNIVLLAVLSGCALSLVSAQHEARRTHIALEHAQAESRRLDADWNHLRIQQTSLSAAALVDARARGQLGMDGPLPHRTLHALRDPATGEIRLGALAPPPGSRPGQRTATISPATSGEGRSR